MYVNGLVSVIIPTYKRSDTLYRAIDSVLTQTYTNIEVIVVNDNYNDDLYSKELIKKMQRYSTDKRVQLIFQKQHINGAAARNEGIKNSKGEFICFLDDDDWFEKEKIELQVNELLKLDSSYGAVTCLKKYYKNNNLYRISLPYKDGYIFNDVLMYNTTLSNGAVLMKRKCLDETGYFDINLKRHQDIQVYSQFCKKYKIKLIKFCLLNLDCSDTQNKPSVDKILQIKSAFENSLSCFLTDSEKKRLHKRNLTSVGFSCLRNKNFYLGLKMLIKAFPTFPYLFMIYKIWRKTKKERKNIDENLKKYSV